MTKPEFMTEAEFIDEVVKCRNQALSPVEQKSKSIAFMVGSATSYPLIPDVEGMIEFACEKLKNSNNPLQLDPKDDRRTQYGKVMSMARKLQINILQEVVKLSEGKKRPDAVRAIASLYTHHGIPFSGPIITSNFDSLIAEEINEMMPRRAIEMIAAKDDDVSILRTSVETIPVVYIHGHWSSDSLHSESEIGISRVILQRWIEEMLEAHLFIVVGYGAWNDVFMRALEKVKRPKGIRWLVHKKSPDIAKEIPDLHDKLEKNPVLAECIKFVDGVDCHTLLPKLVTELKKYPPITSRRVVFRPESKTDIHGWAFSAEILKKPLTIEKENGILTVTVDRRGAVEGLYNSEGKDALVKRTSSSDINYPEPEGWNRKYYDALKKQEPLSQEPLSMDYLPFRWASGGVIPIVSFEGSKENWIPFFFRDIEPVGWNIPLGASESEDEVNTPSFTARREFMEEFLIAEQDPHDNNSFICIPLMPESHGKEDNWKALGEARGFQIEHIKLRNQLDAPRKFEWGTDNKSVIFKEEKKGLPNIKIVDRKTGMIKNEEGMLCLPDADTLGIETVRIVRFTLSKNQFLLDGELSPSKKSLVAAPIGLFKESYLQRIFLKGCIKRICSPLQLYTWRRFDTKQQGDPRQRPYQATELPGTDEFKLFDWDVRFRKGLIDAKADNVPNKVALAWFKNFKKYFFNSSEHVIQDNPCPYFTPATKHALSALFCT